MFLPLIDSAVSGGAALAGASAFIDFSLLVYLMAGAHRAFAWRFAPALVCTHETVRVLDITGEEN